MRIPPIRYLALRTIRRNLPSRLVSFLQERGIGSALGRDSVRPAETVAEYASFLHERGVDISGARIIVLGYGGGFGIALELLEAGAARVALHDPYASPRRRLNDRLDSARMEKYFRREGRNWIPRPEFVEIIEETLEKGAPRLEGAFDMIISSSVLEHVANVDSLVGCSARILADGGVCVHDIDLRDHYFRYPFEMLCHSEKVWRRYLNAKNNLNRLRCWDYRAIFERHFGVVDIDITAADPESWKKIEDRVLPQFKSGDIVQDSATFIRVFAR